MKKYRLVIDIGNTNVVYGIYFNGLQVFSWRSQTVRTADQELYFADIQSHLSAAHIQLPQIERICLSSVVPYLKEIFTQIITSRFNCPFLFVDAYTDLGLSFPMPDPGFIGSDLIVSAYAALQKYETNCLICDFGTATTLHLISAEGFFFGSAIMPGVVTSSDSLFAKAAQLFKIDLSSPAHLLGTSTRDSMLSGIINGNRFMLDGFIRAIKNKYQNLPQILTIATGGIAPLICENSPEVDLIDPNLVLDGLNLICDKIENNA